MTTPQESVTMENSHDQVTDSVLEALRGLQYGEITITVRDGCVVQIERIARKRQFKSKPRNLRNGDTDVAGRSAKPD